MNVHTDPQYNNDKEARAIVENYVLTASTVTDIHFSSGRFDLFDGTFYKTSCEKDNPKDNQMRYFEVKKRDYKSTDYGDGLIDKSKVDNLFKLKEVCPNIVFFYIWEDEIWIIELDEKNFKKDDEGKILTRKVKEPKMTPDNKQKWVWNDVYYFLRPTQNNCIIKREMNEKQ